MEAFECIAFINQIIKKTWKNRKIRQIGLMNKRTYIFVDSKRH